MDSLNRSESFVDSFTQGNVKYKHTVEGKSDIKVYI